MQKFWITNKLNNGTAEIFLYGYIDPYDVSAGDFIKELRSLEKDYANINVRINSGGGSVFEGLAIYNAMQQSTANIETWVDGLAASMASIIALAGKKCHMSKSAMIMTHKPSVGSYGNSDEHKKNAQLLDGLEQTMLSIYASRTGKSTDDCKNTFLNGKDNWFSAEEAKQAGLVDDIYDNPAIEAPKEKKDAKNVWNMYSTQQFAAVFNNQNNDHQMKNLTPAAMTALNITDTADEAAVSAAIVALAQKAAKVDGLQSQLTTAQARVTELEAAGSKKEVTDMLTDARDKDKKITQAQYDVLAKQYDGKPTELKALLDTMNPIGGVVKQINGGGAGDKMKKFEGKGWTELDEAGLLEELKAADENVFFDKFKEKFSKPHPEDKREA